ncbi:class D beta-lactamase [Fluoribacter dumoffii]|uniref:Beta-lactamase n=1 Tax=Fluoribacter dumoffii TaxID=463 RepID=A0A377G7V2_9GAMM|nr:class D beta-lactamase [Fluoribacter dumoffii]KTC89319.1 beta-lactamase AmpS [Fluoribacter dumoffii NY 23]MCW8386922.1 class D beta-lactamase [Fluoribacter dumoffii]MCW8417574.1 class D beta-lactamase [Fluoribacter dumoffii]MCW8454585.1 class D beta-lactamase [Fluoribacter dumoffii]MCW8461339.1 class D beta-lactamase [Fluoribacter dumoffii]
MKKIAVFLSAGFLLCGSAWTQESCFLAQEEQTVLHQEGNDCNQRYSPNSTFKIPLSLMGFDAGILKDATHPEWPYKKEYELFLNVWKYPHNPHSWMRDSCVWYSQVLTQKLGMKRFKGYVGAFHYGNEDVAGDKGKNNGLTHAWLSSSLAISPVEQIQFLQKMIHKKLPVHPKAFAMTKDILYLQELAGGWKLYGKTGTGQQLTRDKSRKLPLQHGWFVGWIEKEGRMITFASHIADSKEKTSIASFRAKNEALNKLFYLINDLEK